MRVFESDVERAVSRTDVTRGHEDHVHKCPHPQAPEAEEFPDALLPVAEVEPVRPEAPESDGEAEGGVPAVAPGPGALHSLAEHLLAQADGVGLHGAVGDVPVGLAGGGACAAAA